MKPAVASVLTAVLLFLSFPPCDFSIACWVALVPLFLLLRSSRPRAAYLASHLTGVLFFIALQSWALRVGSFNILSFSLTTFLLGAYFGIFGLLANYLHRRIPRWSFMTFPSAWVAVEYLRSHAGFLSWPWGIVGYSQYQAMPVLKVAAITGVYGISFLVAAVSAALAALGEAGVKGMRRPGSTEAAAFLAGFLVILAVFFALPETSRGGQREIKAALIQGNVAIKESDHLEDRLKVYGVYKEETTLATTEKPALIVWPSASVPGTIPAERALVYDIGDVARMAGSYLLVGSAGFDKLNGEQRREGKVANSAFLFSPEGRIIGRYDKVRLLPFNEYYPFRGVIRWPSWIVSPTMKDSLPGKTFSLFAMDGLRFGVLICWENYFPEHFREMALLGADFIVSMSNDSFTDSLPARRQMLAMNVLRAAENGIFVLRTTPKGISAAIAPSGRIIEKVQDAGGRTEVKGYLTKTISPAPGTTFYLRHGNVFLAVITASLVLAFAASLLVPAPDRGRWQP